MPVAQLLATTGRCRPRAESPRLSATMMTSQFPDDIRQRIHRCGVIAVLVIDEAKNAVPLAQSLLDGGVNCMELTLRTPAAVDSLRHVVDAVPDMLCGIGTILQPDQVDTVVDAGAAFGVAPGLQANVVQKAQELGLPFAPGVVTPSDVESAITLGCRELKFFPAQPSGGTAYLKSMNAPYSHLGLSYIPLGGVNSQNMIDYLKQPFVPAVGGSWLAPRDLIQRQDWSAITKNALEARRLIDDLRNKS